MSPKCHSCRRASALRILVGGLLLVDFLSTAGLLVFIRQEAERSAVWQMQALVLLLLLSSWLVGAITLVTLNRILRCFTES